MIEKSLVERKPRLLIFLFFFMLLALAQGCRFISRGRTDGAFQVPIGLDGSLQNPAWSPDGNRLVFTRFRNGYNSGSADLYIIEMNTWVLREFATDGAMNVNLPGSAWKATSPTDDWIAFSRDKDSHDEIFVQPSADTNSGEIQVTERANYVAYEPSFSPDADWIVFESHRDGDSGNGVIFKTSRAAPGICIPLTAIGKDCRQPNWSPEPAVDLILYQQLEGSRWSLWTMTSYGWYKRKITPDTENCTDASFSPDGTEIIMSTAHNTLRFDNLYRMPSTGGEMTRVTFYDNGYDGAPSWSPDGIAIAFESCEGTPEDAGRTSIWIINLP
ncbi:MAG: PD40 domain-containing protein [Spirochaetales bacterium]|nr:PD40 domain-containing protein [Spirochaetales bacterium]